MTTRRRELLIALGAGALAWAGAVRAQAPPTVRRIGLLSGFSPSVYAPSYQAFLLGLRDLGWVEGKNISVEYRYAEGRHDRLPDLAADLVRLKVDVIVTTATSDALAAQKATRAIPIVMVAAGDPVASGLVESLARPGGNVTGLSQMLQELAGKRLELLKEMVPKLSRVAVLWNPQSASATLNWKENQQPARQLGIQLHSLEVRSPNELDKAFEAATRARAGALAILPDPVISYESKTNRGLCGKEPLAVDLSVVGIRGRWRSCDLWARPCRLVPARCHLRGQDPQGHEARRSSSRTADQVRAGGKLEDRESARDHDPAVGPVSRR